MRIQGQAPADLVGTPLLLERVFNPFPSFGGNPRLDFPASSCLRQFLRFLGTVAAQRHIPFQFAPDGGFVDA